MNGRVYDYNVGRFMSVDPVIQAPGNSQSINPYSYIMNNPLAGTDPTGYVAKTKSMGFGGFAGANKCTDFFVVCGGNGFNANDGNNGTDIAENTNTSQSVTSINSQDSIATDGNQNPSGDNQNTVTFGGTQFELVENFNTNETGNHFTPDGSGGSIQTFEFTKQTDGLRALEGGPRADGTLLNATSSVNLAVGVAGVAAGLSEVSNAALYPPKGNVIMHKTPTLNVPNIGTHNPYNLKKPLVSFTGVGKLLAAPIAITAGVFTVAQSVEGMRTATTRDEHLSYAIKGSLDMTIILSSFAIGGLPGLGLGLAATYLAADYIFDFRKRIESDLNRTTLIKAQARLDMNRRRDRKQNK